MKVHIIKGIIDVVASDNFLAFRNREEAQKLCDRWNSDDPSLKTSPHLEDLGWDCKPSHYSDFVVDSLVVS